VQIRRGDLATPLVVEVDGIAKAGVQAEKASWAHTDPERVSPSRRERLGSELGATRGFDASDHCPRLVGHVAVNAIAATTPGVNRGPGNGPARRIANALGTSWVAIRSFPTSIAFSAIAVEPDTPQRLPAAMRTAFHVAPVLVLPAESDAAIRAVVEYHRARLLCCGCIGTTLLVRGAGGNPLDQRPEIVAVGPRRVRF
jgi:hypothetical protein